MGLPLSTEAYYFPMKKLVFFVWAFVFGMAASAQTYTPVTVTGYNADVVAEGTGPALTLTTNDVDGASNSFMAAGYTNPANATTSRGLPANGLIVSAVASTPGLTYQLAPFTGNNSLRLNGAAAGTLTLATPASAAIVYVLATSGSGTSNTAITITFTDNTTQVYNLLINDWFGGTGFAIQGLGRVNRNSNFIDNNAIDPRLYQYALTLSPFNIGKQIQSIAFTNTGKVLNVMGITLATPSAPLTYSPVPLTGFTDDVVANLPGPANQSANNDMDGGLVGNRFSFVTQNYRNPSGQGPTTFLPANGFINSAATPGLTFQLADYNASNTMRIKGIGSGNLNFVTPRAARMLYLLGGAGNALTGNCFFNVIISFTDGTTQTVNNMYYADWFGMGDVVALQGVSRVNFDNNAIQSSFTDPSLYQKPVAILPANYGKLIQAVTIEKLQTLGTLNVLAISAGSGCTSAPAGGTATVDIASICSPTKINLSLTGAVAMPEIVYQWQKSIDNGLTWINILNANTTATSDTAKQTTLYRAQVICGSQTGNSVPDTVKFVAPAAGQAFTDVATICGPAKVKLALSGAEAALSVTYQWQKSVDNGLTWMNILNATTDTLTDLATQTTLYQAQVICGTQVIASVPDTVVLLAPVASVAYASTDFCPIGKSPAPVASPAGGAFTAETGLVIDSQTGIIDLETSEAGKYLITYSMGGLCPVADTTTIRIEAAPKPRFPNVITPNGDDLNDRFLLQLPTVSEYRMRIFSRWGKLIWETTDPVKGWEGDKNGVYYYYVDFKDCAGNKQAFKGFLEVLD